MDHIHYGIDYGCTAGKPVLAAADGVATFSGSNAPWWVPTVTDGAWGEYIEVEHGDGYSTGYAHLSRRMLAAGTRIARGHVLGLSGNTGISTGPHLHFQLLYDGQRVDPRPYMR